MSNNSVRSTNKLYMAAVIVFAAAVLAVVFLLNQRTKVNDDSVFPDKALQQYLSERVDTNGNGQYDDDEVAAVTSLDGFEGHGITSLRGIEIFTNLEYLDASNAGIEKIFNTYTDGLFSNNEDKELPNLKVLNLSGNNIQSIGFQNSCPNLEELYCSGGTLERLSLGKQDKLTTLDCSYNQLSGELILNDASHLTNVNCSFNQIERLGLPTSVLNLNCSDNAIVKIGFGGGSTDNSTTLDSLYCQNNQLVCMVAGSGIAWNSIGLSSLDYCNISNNPGIRIKEGYSGGWYIDFDTLNP